MKDIILNCEMSSSEFIDPQNISEIVDSNTFAIGRWKEMTNLTGFPKGVAKSVIPVDMGFYRLNVLTDVEPGTEIRKHKHNEPIFRYIVSGSLRLNGRDYKAGDWIIVPSNYPYEITTEEGYVAMAGYGMQCEDDD